MNDSTDPIVAEDTPASPTAERRTDPAPARGEAPVRRNPAKKIALAVIVLLGLLVAWYATTDRLAPYSSRGAIAAYVAQVAPRVSGQLTEVLVQDNAIVAAGQPLFRLDSRPFEIAVRQAEANLAQATQSIDASSASLVASQARVAEARANLVNVRAASGRTMALVERGIASRAQQDAAEADVYAAEAQFGTAEANLRAAEAELGAKGQDNPQIQAAQFTLEQAQYDLLSTTIVAPERGVVTNVGLTPGQYAAAGTPALTFLGSQGAWIVVDFRENQLANVRPGNRVGILFDAVPGAIFSGRVHSVAWGIDPGRPSAGGLPQNQPETRWFEPARRMPVRIEFEGGMDNWPMSARAGGKVSAVVYTGDETGAIARIAKALHHVQSLSSYLY
ncbi:MAG: HlyD family secretion protein [Aurantimonas endophytica]|uniref:HlyD family secretion protein n=1 Tax=Aurantimonas endophytica TaxID=1522175 RepID=UPI0030024EDF